jgi:hypothetical protein
MGPLRVSERRLPVQDWISETKRRGLLGANGRYAFCVREGDGEERGENKSLHFP